MELEYRQLSGDEIQQGLADLSGWDVEGDKLMKVYTFETYRAGLDFAVRVAEIAEAMDHHPDIEICYQKVRISVNTHSVGGLSPYDFELARRVDSLRS